eukprot:COSAG02_NODE_4015_length_5905_cov_2.481915_3_plen_222_part_00
MLKLSKAQYKALCSDCAAEMMRGAGHGGKIPDFSGTDMKFYVKDPQLRGGGFMDTLSNTWQKVKTFVSESPLAQKVVKEGLSKGKALAKDVAGKAVQMGLEKLGVPESAMGAATSLAGEAFDRLGDAAERKAQAEIIGKAPTTLPGVPNAPAPPSSRKSKRSSSGAPKKSKKRRLEGSGMTDIGPIELGHGASVSAVAFDRSVLPDGATVVNKTNALQLAY